MIGRSLVDEMGAAAAKLFLPVGVSVATVLKALDPQWFIAIPTATYAIGQLAYLIWKWRRESRAKSAP